MESGRRSYLQVEEKKDFHQLQKKGAGQDGASGTDQRTKGRSDQIREHGDRWSQKEKTERLRVEK